MLKRFIIQGIITVFLTVSTPSVMAMQPMMVQENPLLGTAAPNFKLSDLNSKSYQLDEIRNGKKAILFFWATWCPHCRTQLTEIQNNLSQFQAKGVEIVLIDSGETEAQVRSYLKKNGVNMNVYLDIHGNVSNQFRIMGLPTFVYINEEGIITSVQHQLLADFIKYF